MEVVTRHKPKYATLEMTRADIVEQMKSGEMCQVGICCRWAYCQKLKIIKE